MSPNDPDWSATRSELERLWNKFALRGDLDGSNPPATLGEAYNQVIEIQARHIIQVRRAASIPYEFDEF